MKGTTLEQLAKKIKKGAEKDEEVILPDSIALESLAYLKTLKMNSTEDALLFMACANLVNKYIKQHEDYKKLYIFKEDVFWAADILDAKKIPEVKCGFHTDISGQNSRVLVVQIGEIQFSFHDSRKLDKYRNLSADNILEWKKVRLQPHSVFIYEEVKKYVWSRRNDRKNAETHTSAERIIEKYKTFRELMFSNSAVRKQHEKKLPIL